MLVKKQSIMQLNYMNSHLKFLNKLQHLFISFSYQHFSVTYFHYITTFKCYLHYLIQYQTLKHEQE